MLKITNIFKMFCFDLEIILILMFEVICIVIRGSIVVTIWCTCRICYILQV